MLLSGSDTKLPTPKYVLKGGNILFQSGASGELIK